MIPIHLDDLLARRDAAKWLGVSDRWLAEDARSRSPRVPVFKVGRNSLYHPRTVLATFANRAGVVAEVIAASHGVSRPTSPHTIE
jgi:hypothetical protein